MTIVLLTILLAGISTSFFVGSAAACQSERDDRRERDRFDRNKYDNFALQVSGWAYDKTAHKIVGVTLSISGSVKGPERNNLNLRVEDGSASIGKNLEITLSRGSGSVNTKKDDIRFELTFTSSAYGGHPAHWNLDGEIRIELCNHLLISLSADKVDLPNNGKLTNLHLHGILNLW
jgi:hypothetical protein